MGGSNGCLHAGSGCGEACADVDWKAEWVWFGDDPAPFHFFLYARRSFDLASSPRSAVLHITATDRYRLFVNGAYPGYFTDVSK